MNITNNELRFNKSKTNKVNLEELEVILEEQYFLKSNSYSKAFLAYKKFH